jgi:uncharacterized protein
MIDRSVLTEFPCIEEWSILLAYRGSIAHGMFVPNTDPLSIDDKDVQGICIPPMEYYYGLKQFGSAGTMEIMRGVWDIVLFELTKAVKMLAQGNPNILGILWLRPEDYIKVTPAGRLLIDNRQLFVGKHVYNSFVGYAHGQLHKMTALACNGYMGQKRKSLVEKFGYDTNNAAHLIRILRMGIEFLATGELVVKRPDATELLGIKRGEWSLERVHREAERLFVAAQEALIASVLPCQPDREAISRLCVEMAERWLKQ